MRPVNTWDIFKKETADYLPGETFTTSLLGPVRCGLKDGKWLGVIPPELQREANRHGFTVEGAIYKDGVYVLKKI